MTPSQLTTFKAAILADAGVTAFLTAGDHGAIAGYYNTVPASPTFLWRPAISIAELNTAVDWTVFKALTAIVQNTYFAMISAPSIDATSVNVRNGFAAVFTAGSATTLALTALAKKNATRFEALFTTANVCSLFGYTVSVADVAAALGS